MGNKKTNVDYLREIIERHMPEDHKDEAVEFLDGIQKECDDFYDDVKEAEDDAKEFETKYNELISEYDDLKVSVSDGPDSLQAQIVLECFHKLVERVGLFRVERLLDELNSAPYLIPST